MPAKRDGLMERLLEGEQIRQRANFGPWASTTWGNVVPAVPGAAQAIWDGVVGHMTGQHGMINEPDFDMAGAIKGGFDAGTGVGGAGALMAKPAGALGANAIRQGTEAFHWSPNAAQIGPDNKFKPGTHFGSPWAAQQRMADEMANPKPAPAGGTIPVQMDINRPLRIDDPATQHDVLGIATELENTLSRPGLTTQMERAQAAGADDATLYGLLDELLQKEGYDGLVYRNAVEDAGSDSYIATRPGTVRSAITDETLFSDPLAALMLQQLEDDQ